jgi:DNA-binding response OmpR family regulator
MVVDDDQGTALFFKFCLEEHGFVVDAFTHPYVALSRFKPGVYKLMIVDTRMPEINGFEFFQEIKKLDNTQRVCFTTSFEVYYESLKEFYPSLDVQCFIPKPITKEDLLRRITEYLC